MASDATLTTYFVSILLLEMTGWDHISSNHIIGIVHLPAFGILRRSSNEFEAAGILFVITPWIVCTRADCSNKLLSALPETSCNLVQSTLI